MTERAIVKAIVRGQKTAKIAQSTHKLANKGSYGKFAGIVIDENRAIVKAIVSDCELKR